VKKKGGTQATAGSQYGCWIIRNAHRVWGGDAAAYPGPKHSKSLE